jgi:hypothetical protein
MGLNYARAEKWRQRWRDGQAHDLKRLARPPLK